MAISVNFTNKTQINAPLLVTEQIPDTIRYYINSFADLTNLTYSLGTGMQVFNLTDKALYILTKEANGEPSWFKANTLTANDFTKIIDSSGNTGEGITYAGSLSSVADILGLTPTVGGLYDISADFTIPETYTTTGNDLDVVAGNIVLCSRTESGVPKFNTLVNINFSLYAKKASTRLITASDWLGHYSVGDEDVTIQATDGYILVEGSIKVTSDADLSAWSLDNVTVTKLNDTQYEFRAQNVYKSNFSFNLPTNVTVSFQQLTEILGGLKIAFFNSLGELINVGKSIDELVTSTSTTPTSTQPDAQPISSGDEQIDGPIITFVGEETSTDVNNKYHITVASEATMVKDIAEDFVEGFSKVYWLNGPSGYYTRVPVTAVTSGVYEGLILRDNTTYLLIIDVNLHQFICTSTLCTKNDLNGITLEDSISNYPLGSGFVIPQSDASAIVFGIGDNAYIMEYSLN